MKTVIIWAGLSEWKARNS